jgi:hypothetical protein
MRWIIIIGVIIVSFIAWRMFKTRLNVKWSRAKGLVIYGPKMFGHHFIYVDKEYKVAVILPKSDETLHILIGNPTEANRWIKYDSDGNEAFDRNLSGNEYQWKINKKEVRYRGNSLEPSGPGHKGKVMNYSNFGELISQQWIKKKKNKMYQIYRNEELPTTPKW